MSLPQESTGGDMIADDEDDSALLPRAARRTTGPPAEKSRTQQKLNLQRASSVIEPGQTGGGGAGIAGAGGPLIGVYDHKSRDPRVGKLLERTGMEYRVIRRFQNPVSRSLARLSHIPGQERRQGIPRNSAAANGMRGNVSGGGIKGHTRIPSLPEQRERDGLVRRPVTPRRANSIRLNGAGSSFEADDDAERMQERLSGSSLVGGEEEDGTTALLRNLWEKSIDLSASQE